MSPYVDDLWKIIFIFLIIQLLQQGRGGGGDLNPSSSR